MWQGTVTPDLKPVIDLTLLGQEEIEQAVSVTLDTGFSDYLTLPREVIVAMGWPLSDFVEVILATGTLVVLDAYLGSVVWQGNRREVSVLASKSGAYLGMALLYGSRITIDVLYGGEVSILPIS